MCLSICPVTVSFHMSKTWYKCLSISTNIVYSLYYIVSVSLSQDIFSDRQLLGRRKPSKDAGRRPAIQWVILEFLEFHGLFPIPFSFSYIRGTPHSFINQNVYYFGKQHELTEFWIGIQSTKYVCIVFNSI